MKKQKNNFWVVFFTIIFAFFSICSLFFCLFNYKNIALLYIETTIICLGVYLIIKTKKQI